MKNIIYFSFVDWFWIKQRPHHFAELLSEKYHVDFICTQSWKKNSNVINSHSDDKNNLSKNKFRVNDNLTIYRKKMIPKERKYSFIRKINNETIMKPFLYKLDKKNNYDTVILSYPLQYEYIDNDLFINKKIIYDCMDNYKEFNGVASEELQKSEANLVKRADLIIVSSDKLKEVLVLNYPNIDDKIKVINNGVDIIHFDVNKTQKPSGLIIKNKYKKIGYIGTISDWVDLDLIEKVTNEIENIEFYMIGPKESHLDITKYLENPKLIFTGSIPYSKIPGIIKEMDVLIMPFVVNDVVESVNPVKIYEYLAMGKQIVATKYKETEKFKDLIELYHSGDYNDFINKINKVLTKINESDSIQKKIDFAEKNSWQSRIDAFCKIVDN